LRGLSLAIRVRDKADYLHRFEYLGGSLIVPEKDFVVKHFLNSLAVSNCYSEQDPRLDTASLGHEMNGYSSYRNDF
jgi:hypothetical protein